MPAPRLPPAPAPNPGIPAALDRSALLAMAAQAADAFASNIPMPAQIDTAAGRRFDLVLPFGCAAPSAVESTGGMRWSFDPKAATLRVAVDPSTWRSDEWIDAAVADAGGVFRGFWIARPWSTATNCAALRKPNADAGDAPVVLPGQTVAIARLIDAEEGGKIRSYGVVQRSTGADFDPEQGFQLRILGRIQSVSGESPIKCVQPRGGEQPPRCVITASFTEVRIENPKNGAVLASWPISDDVRGDKAAGGSDSARERR